LVIKQKEMAREIITYTEFENIVIKTFQRYAQCVIAAIEDEEEVQISLIHQNSSLKLYSI